VRSQPALFGLIGCLLTAALSACGSDHTVTPHPATPVWSEIDDLVPPTTFYALWAPSDDYVIAVGARGDARAWDGSRWSAIANETSVDLFSIAGSPTGAVVAVGDNGTAVRMFRGSLVRTDTPTTENLRSVWMAAPGTFFVVGERGTVMHGDGTNWSVEPAPTPVSLFSAWGTGPSDVFAVRNDGVILHYDGVDWNEMQSGTTEILAAVSGASANDVYAVGGAGTILHYDGSSWSAMESGSTSLLQSVWGGAEPAVVGANATVLRLAGGVWARETPPTTQWLYGAARSGGLLWLVGAHAILTHDGTAWSRPTRGTVPTLRGMTDAPSTGMVALGDKGYVALGRPGEWRMEDASAIHRLNEAWTSPDGDVFAVGTNRILRRVGAQWVEESTEITEFYDIGGNESIVFAVGEKAAIRRRAGTAWVPMQISSEVSITDNLHAIAMSSEEGFIAGENGRLVRWDGAAWWPMWAPTSAELWDVVSMATSQWRAIAVGEGGTIVALANSAFDWTAMTSPATTTLYSLAWGPNGELFAAGEDGTVLSRVDDAWVRIAVPTTRTLLCAWSYKGALFACGGDAIDGGLLLRYGPPLN